MGILLAGLFVIRTAAKKQARKEESESRMSITSIEIDVGSVDTKGTQTSMVESSPTACDVDVFIEDEAPTSSVKPYMADILPTAHKSVSLQSK